MIKREEISDRIRQAIGKKSINSFAVECGVSESLLRKYISGSCPGFDKAASIAQAAGVDLTWLATGENSVHQCGQEQPAMEASPKSAEQGRDITDAVNIQELINMTAEVLVSDTVYRPALAANIKAFHRSIALEHDNQEFRIRIERMEQRQEVERISFEQRMTAMEEKLTQATASPPPKVANG